jgi:hypothetical protein
MMEDLRDCDKRVLGLGLAEEETREKEEGRREGKALGQRR